jgi:hypothetical protein
VYAFVKPIVSMGWTIKLLLLFTWTKILMKSSKKTKSFSFLFFTRNKEMFFVLYYITYWAKVIFSRQRGFAMTPCFDFQWVTIGLNLLIALRRCFSFKMYAFVKPIVSMGWTIKLLLLFTWTKILMKSSYFIYYKILNKFKSK